MDTSFDAHRDYQRIAAAIGYLHAHWNEQPALADVAAEVGLSEFHFQRLFTQWAGISPKRFLQYLTKEYAKQRLRDSASVLDAALDAGLSGTSRLHDLMVVCEAATPGELKRGGEGMTVQVGTVATPFGPAFAVFTPTGLNRLHFLDSPEDEQRARAAARADWPAAHWLEAPDEVAAKLGPFLDHGEKPPLHLTGSHFQLKVWEALLRLPDGALVSYQGLAKLLGVPTGARAVGRALATNPVGWLIPCHRVIRAGGEVNQYRWGVSRKLAMIGWEAARVGDVVV